MKVHIRAYGETAYLVSAPEFELASVRSYLDWQLDAQPPQQLIEHVWGATNLLLVVDSELAAAPVRAWFSAIDADVAETSSAGEVHEVPVTYAGPDLQYVAKQTGLSADEVVVIHSKPIYTVRMMGFSPGFPYLDGLDNRLQIDRRAQPRKRIAAGSVAIGGSHAGIYSVPSPGGWHILGHTDTLLFDPARATGSAPKPSEVFAFQPGERIRFVPL